MLHEQALEMPTLCIVLALPIVLSPVESGGAAQAEHIVRCANTTKVLAKRAADCDRILKYRRHRLDTL